MSIFNNGGNLGLTVGLLETNLTGTAKFVWLNLVKWFKRRRFFIRNANNVE